MHALNAQTQRERVAGGGKGIKGSAALGVTSAPRWGGDGGGGRRKQGGKDRNRE